MEDRVAPLLLAWYDLHARALPWRTPPGMGEGKGTRPDPYRVWLSEVMLQQTTTAAVAPFYARFLARWPDIASLAAAPEEAVMAEWAGLGYYSRARNLVACAREVAARGGFPESEVELRALPGLGAYTAAAIAAIAFGQRAVVVDVNVERVVARLFAIDAPLPAARPAIRAATDRITPHLRPGDFAQAMMDLGATICTPRSPPLPALPAGRSVQGAGAQPAGDATRPPPPGASNRSAAAPAGGSSGRDRCSPRSDRHLACWAACAHFPTIAGRPEAMARGNRLSRPISRVTGARSERCATPSPILRSSSP